MSIVQKIDDALEGLVYIDFNTEIGLDKAKSILRKSLILQDRDTRHACAEAVIGSDDPHGACINCRGGIS